MTAGECDTQCWHRFSVAGSNPLYGFGTLEQAFNFATTEANARK
jgi:hypothetical protein